MLPSWRQSFLLLVGFHRALEVFMTLLRNSPLASAAVALCCRTNSINAFQPTFEPELRKTAPDNSNQKKSQTQTADNQANAQSDRMTAAKIRKTIIADKTLSTYAHNIKINSLAQLPRIPYCAVP
jgi:hyperosmotically inducible protein